MRRISIDTLGLMSPKTGATFEAAKRKRPWYSSRPRLLATCLVFAAFWTWLSLKTHEVLIPDDSFKYLKDESLRDILNTTLGVGQSPMIRTITTQGYIRPCECPKIAPISQTLVIFDSERTDKVLVPEDLRTQSTVPDRPSRCHGPLGRDLEYQSRLRGRGNWRQHQAERLPAARGEPQASSGYSR